VKTRKKKQAEKIYFYCPRIVVVHAGPVDEPDVVVVLKDLPPQMRNLFLEWATLEDRPAYSEHYAYYVDFYDWFQSHSKDFTNA
jgi:hypothetical protein